MSKGTVKWFRMYSYITQVSTWTVSSLLKRVRL